MIFVWLALLAMVFMLLGFLLHAFYFGKRKSLEKSLNGEIQDMNRKLALREKINADAQEDLAHARMLVKSLERQLEQRNEQMNALQNTARRQEEEIRRLQETASEIRKSLAQTEESRTAASAAEYSESVPQPAAGEQERQIPLWKDNLNNILAMLEKLEKETKN